MPHLPARLLTSLLLIASLALLGCGDESGGGHTLDGTSDTGAQDGADGDATAGDTANADTTNADTTAQDGSLDANTDAGDTGSQDTVSDTVTIAGLVSLDVTPADQVLTVTTSGAQETVQYTAMGTFDDNSTRDITTEVRWLTSNPAIGSIGLATGLFTSSNTAGGSAQIIARSGTVEAGTAVTVFLSGAIDDPNASTLPANTVDLFDTNTNTVDDTSSNQKPAIVYPSHETMFPRNIFRILFQWEQGQNNDLFRLSFESPTSFVAVYTDRDRWEADPQTWQWLANSNAGQAVTVQLQAVDSTNPGTIYASDRITIFFSASDVPGAIYYWSTGTEAVMKGLPSGQHPCRQADIQCPNTMTCTSDEALCTSTTSCSVSADCADGQFCGNGVCNAQPGPLQFWTSPENGTCVACHTVSRNGQRLAVGYGGENLQVVDIPSETAIGYVDPPGGDPLTSGDLRYKVGWSTFSPDASMVVFANKGVMTLIDGNTGDPIGPNAGVIDVGALFPNHPDWSPDGKHLAFAASTRADNKNVENGSIYRIAYNDGAWGTPELLVASTGAPDNNYFPMHSPDSSLIAYVNAQGKSKDAPTAVIRLIAADGSQGPVDLARLNTRVKQVDGVASIGNSMPTWAPTSTPGIQWLVFSSLRAYGKVIPAGGRDQLWIAAIDGEIFGASDASFAAFWAPFQDFAASNHRAFWAVDTDQPCVATAEVCDNLDNNCNGVVDEDCTACGDSEICGDGLDNDCNGLVDDQCFGCLDAEICDNFLDDDCNGLIDDGCGACGGIEVCGDGIDNNCNFEIDEGCTFCSSYEWCFDGIDNNCDDQIDENCEGCLSEEICYDNADNDCNGVIDDGCVVN